MESVAAAGIIGGTVLHLPSSSSCFSPRKVLSLVNIRSYRNNFDQFSLRSSPVPSRRIITVDKQVSSVYKYNSTIIPLVDKLDLRRLDSIYRHDNHDNNYNANHANKLLMMINKSREVRNSPNCHRNKFVDTLSRILASLLSYGLLFAFTITMHTLCSRNSALAASYDRIGGSSSVLSTLLSSTSHSPSCNSEKTGQSIHINIVFPYVFQFCASVTVTLLANLYGMLHPYLGQLMMSKRRGSVFFFQVAVSDKEHTLRKRLKKLAENADVSTLNGLNYVLKEVVKALLQYNDSSIHFTHLTNLYAPMMMLRKWFEEFLNRELGRDDVEYTLLNTLVNADNDDEHKNETNIIKSNSNSENVYTVVTVLVLATREHLIPCFKEKGRTCTHSFEVLQTLQRIPINEIQSVEVLWSPRKDNEVLLEDQLLRDFPGLIRIENGFIYTSSI
ncbi:uncharacterized protein LOC141701966 [Apium graveolens]|uniref:uncharacterized protein LOC141701950 n=1 Tax=Apium graveolens TaxID=4045 RepID=UPI003D78D822